VRQFVVAGVGGVLIGHIVWLLGISIARRAPSASTAVLVLSAVLLLASGWVGYQAWQRYQRRELTAAAFLAGLPVSPVIFTVIVLGVTYL
jgi:hypothetical protein